MVNVDIADVITRVVIIGFYTEIIGLSCFKIVVNVEISVRAVRGKLSAAGQIQSGINVTAAFCCAGAFPFGGINI